MDNAELEKRFGSNFCKVFGYEFARTYLRVDISPKELDQQIISRVAKQTDLRTVLLSSHFWIELTNQLDSRYTYRRTNIKSAITWGSISGRFLNNILPHIADFNLPKKFIDNLLKTIDSIFTEKNFTSVNDLLDYQVEENFNDLFENDDVGFGEDDIVFEDIISKTATTNTANTQCDNQEESKMTNTSNVNNVKPNSNNDDLIKIQPAVPTSSGGNSKDLIDSKDQSPTPTDKVDIQCDMISSNDYAELLQPISDDVVHRSSNKIELINEAFDIDEIEESPPDDIELNKDNQELIDLTNQLKAEAAKSIGKENIKKDTNDLNEEFNNIISDAVASLTDSVKDQLIDLTTKLSKTKPAALPPSTPTQDSSEINDPVLVIDERPLDDVTANESVTNNKKKKMTKKKSRTIKSYGNDNLGLTNETSQETLISSGEVKEKQKNTSGEEIIDLTCNNQEFFQEFACDNIAKSNTADSELAIDADQSSQATIEDVVDESRSRDGSLVIDVENNENNNDANPNPRAELELGSNSSDQNEDVDLFKPGPSRIRKRSVYFINDKKLEKLQRQSSVERRREFVKKVTAPPIFNDSIGTSNFLPTTAKRKKVKLRQVIQNTNNESEDDDWLYVRDNETNLEDDNVSTGSNLSFASRVNYQKLFTDNKAKHAYTSDEDQNILKYIIKSGRYSEIKGNHLWKEMAEKNICFTRSWQSMKERFRKTIGPNLALYSEMFQINEKELEYLQNNTYLVPKQTNINEPDDDDDDDDDDNVSRRSVQSKKSHTKTKEPRAMTKVIAGNGYSHEEDEEIVRFVFKLQPNEAIRGRAIWTRLAKEFTNRSRSWQSLRERFIKRIAPKIYGYQNVDNYERAIKIVQDCLPSLNEQNRIKEILKNKFNRTRTKKIASNTARK